MRDHSPLVVNNFRGTFDRGEDEVVPPGYFISALNWEFTKDGVQTRAGFIPENHSVNIPSPFKAKRIEIYERIGEAQRLLMLDDGGRIWDSITGTAILFIPGMTDFSCTTMYNRSFITPHNGQVGLAGEKVYVYEGSGVCRPAAGAGPTPTPPLTVANSALSGHVEKGIHVYGVAFESVSGYISTIGAFVAFNSVGERKVDIGAIPLGPSGTVARVLFATKEILEIPSDPTTNTFFFVENGRIPDNTTTTKTLDFFDADLMDDGSYLLENLDSIPAGVGIGQYKGRLIVWGENSNSAVIRVSQSGQPENHNGADGYLTVYPGIGGGVKNCAEYRNQLIILKSNRAYSTQDNDDVAATWDVGEVDGSVGTECHGIGQILNIGTNIEDRLFIADKAGLRIFVGTFTDSNVITFNIDDIWTRITKTAYQNIEVSVDAINALIYVSVPLDGATSPTHILFGDYSEGLDEDAIRWSLWKSVLKPTSIVLALVNGEPVLKIGSIDGFVVAQDQDSLLDLGQRIECFCKFPLYPVGDIDEGVNHYTGVRMRARGIGILDIGLEGLDAVETANAQSLVLTERPGIPLWRGFNFTSEHCAVTLTLQQSGAWMIMTKFVLYVSPVWESRAQVG